MEHLRGFGAKTSGVWSAAYHSSYYAETVLEQKAAISSLLSGILPLGVTMGSHYSLMFALHGQ